MHTAPRAALENRFRAPDRRTTLDAPRFAATTAGEAPLVPARLGVSLDSNAPDAPSLAAPLDAPTRAAAKLDGATLGARPVGAESLGCSLRCPLALA